MVSVMEVGIGLVTGVICYTIVDSVIATTSWNSTLAATIVVYLVPIGLLGLMAYAAYAR